MYYSTRHMERTLQLTKKQQRKTWTGIATTAGLIITALLVADTARNLIIATAYHYCTLKGF